VVDIPQGRSIDYNHTPKYIRRRFENADSVINKIRTFTEDSSPEEIHVRYMTGRNFHNKAQRSTSAGLLLTGVLIGWCPLFRYHGEPAAVYMTGMSHIR